LAEQNPATHDDLVLRNLKTVFLSLRIEAVRLKKPLRLLVEPQCWRSGIIASSKAIPNKRFTLPLIVPNPLKPLAVAPLNNRASRCTPKWFVPNNAFDIRGKYQNKTDIIVASGSKILLRVGTMYSLGKTSGLDIAFRYRRSGKSRFDSLLERIRREIAKIRA
jgi:hypothetical protein